MMKLQESASQVAKKIKELRMGYRSGGLSQEELANTLGVKTNTISRWKTGVYKPKLKDLDRLSVFFSIPVSEFFTDQNSDSEPVDLPLKALMHAAKDLMPEDLKELKEFAEFRKSRIKPRQKNGSI